MTIVLPPPAASPSAAPASSNPAQWSVRLTDVTGRVVSAAQASLDGVVTSGLILRALDQLDRMMSSDIPPIGSARNDLRDFTEPQPGRDAIETWAAQAEAQWADRESGRPVQVGDGLAWMGPRGRLQSLARHDRSVLVFHLPPGIVRWELTYRPSDEDTDSRRRFRAAAGGIVSRLSARWWRQDVAEFTIYAGANTTVASAEAISAGWRPKTVVVDHDQRQGVVIAKVSQQLKKPAKLRRDPSFQPRLGQWVAMLGPLVDQYPELADMPAQSVNDAVIFVHGTLSCGLAHLRELAAALPALPGQRILRFEHDTFLPVLDNKDELVQLITKASAGPHAKIILVGHSRGGLVARAAAAYFTKHPGGPKIAVCTFGTPHRGTPLVRAGERVLSGLAAAASAGVGHVGVPPLATAPIRYLFGRLKKLPIGILNMAVDAELLRGMDEGFDAAEMVTFGADFIRGTNPASRGVMIFDKFGKQFFFDSGHWQPNDLLVVVTSATAVGHGHLTHDGCGHFDYLAQLELAEAVRYLHTRLSQ